MLTAPSVTTLEVSLRWLAWVSGTEATYAAQIARSSRGLYFAYLQRSPSLLPTWQNLHLVFAYVRALPWAALPTLCD